MGLRNHRCDGKPWRGWEISMEDKESSAGWGIIGVGSWYGMKSHRLLRAAHPCPTVVIPQACHLLPRAGNPIHRLRNRVVQTNTGTHPVMNMIAFINTINQYPPANHYPY